MSARSTAILLLPTFHWFSAKYFAEYFTNCCTTTASDKNSRKWEFNWSHFQETDYSKKEEGKLPDQAQLLPKPYNNTLFAFLWSGHWNLPIQRAIIANSRDHDDVVSCQFPYLQKNNVCNEALPQKEETFLTNVYSTGPDIRKWLVQPLFLTYKIHLTGIFSIKLQMFLRLCDPVSTATLLKHIFRLHWRKNSCP